MKKLLTLALCSIMVLGLGSCGKKNSSSNPISSNPDTTETSTPDSSSEESSDTGTSDTGSTDSGSTDSGSTDSGSSDSGSTDSGSTDSGSTDSGSSDSGDTTPTTAVIYFQNNWKWSDVRAYLFNSADNTPLSEWPGESMVVNGYDGVGDLHEMYVLEIDLTAPFDTVVFNGWDAGKDNAETGEKGATNQTPDIKIADILATEHNAIYVTWDQTANEGAGANSYGTYTYVPTPAYTSYSILVNGTDVSTTAAVEKGSDYAKFTTTLAVGDSVVIKGETTELDNFTATVAGEHTFTVNVKNVVSVNAPKDPNAETFTYTISMPWNGFSDNAKVYAWVWGTGVEATWVECTDGGDNKIVFETEEANYTHCIPMRMPSGTTTPGWDGAWNRGSSQQSGHADIAFTDYAATAYWVNP